MGNSAELCAEQGQSVLSAWGSYWHRGEWVVPVATAAYWAQASAGLNFFAVSVPVAPASLGTS